MIRESYDIMMPRSKCKVGIGRLSTVGNVGIRRIVANDDDESEVSTVPTRDGFVAGELCQWCRVLPRQIC